MRKIYLYIMFTMMFVLNTRAEILPKKQTTQEGNSGDITNQKMTEASLEKKLYDFLNSNKDPFNTNYNSKSISGGTGVPPGIEIRGVIITETGKRYASLQLPGYARPLIMQENESVRLSLEQLATKGIQRSSDIYIRVVGIERDGVKIIQERRPDQVITLK